MNALPGLDRRFDLTIWADGSSFGQAQPGASPTGGLGFSIYARDGRQLYARSKVVTDCDNNEAEVRAILEAVRKASEFTTGRVKIYTDSQTARQLLTQKQRPYTRELEGLVREYLNLRGRFRRVVIHQIPRRQNKVADALSRVAVKLFLSPRPKKRSFWSFFR